MIEVDCPLCKKFGPSLGCRICRGTGKTFQKTGAEKKKARNDKSKKDAINTGTPFTPREILLLQNDTYSTSYLAKRLKRTYKSVENMRYRLRRGLYHGNKQIKK